MIAILGLAAATAVCEARAKETRLTVMSYNIRYGKAHDGDNSWDNRKAATTAMLKDVKPDIFGVQEALKNQAKYIERTCPKYKGYGVGRKDGKDKDEHMSIFYNTKVLDMLDCGTYWLSETPDVPSKGWDARHERTATWALMQVRKTGEKFFFVNTHLDNKGKQARKNGLALIVERIAAMNPDGYPMVLTGDFNVKPSDNCLDDLDKIMTSARKSSIFPEKGSYNGFGSANKIIDYIYYSGFSKCRKFDVVDKTYKGIPYISDHYPIVTELVF